MVAPFAERPVRKPHGKNNLLSSLEWFVLRRPYCLRLSFLTVCSVLGLHAQHTQTEIIPGRLIIKHLNTVLPQTAERVLTLHRARVRANSVIHDSRYSVIDVPVDQT